jgi:hypothetical protein
MDTLIEPFCAHKTPYLGRKAQRLSVLYWKSIEVSSSSTEVRDMVLQVVQARPKSLCKDLYSQ